MSAQTKTFTRTDIQGLLKPAVESALALASVPVLDHVIARRLMRALVHLGAARLLALGAPPQVILGLCVEAVAKEVGTYQKQIEETAVEASWFPFGTKKVGDA